MALSEAMILLLGARGYVGSRFCSFLAAQGLKVKTLSRSEIDYVAARPLRRLLQEVRPDFLINAAGYTGKPNVDACESAKADTLEGNVVLPLRLGEICAELDLPWGHVSSGCIYQGFRQSSPEEEISGFREDESPNFSFDTGEVSFYSGSKALAEGLLHGFPKLYIWRLRVPFESRDNPRNYLTKLLRYERLIDVRNSLSHLDDFVASAWTMMDRGLPYGTYNLTNPGSVTTREVIELLGEEAARRRKKGDLVSAERFGKKIEWFESESEFRKVAKAPRSSCVLDTSKAESFGLPLRPVRQAVVDSLERWEWEQQE